MDTSLAKEPYSGKLLSWDDVSEAEDWDALVLGNGASINLWTDFQYGSLFHEAKASKLFSEDDQTLFDKLGVENFEVVLHSLSESIRIGEALGQDRSLEVERHASIQETLAQAVRGVHVEGGEIPLTTFEAIREELRNYRYVFTTSYDLILYWSAAKGPQGFTGFYDFFWADNRNAFDATTITLSPLATSTRLYFLHGALHLVVLVDGTTCKRTASFLTLLNQFGQPFKGDRTARPLIVTEARAADKRRSIEDNEYLSYCWRILHECSSALVVFGHSLSEQDAHLIDAINEHSNRPIAVGIRDGSERKNRREQHRIASLVEARPLYFFDSVSHPLGKKELQLKEAPWRKSFLPRIRKAA